MPENSHAQAFPLHQSQTNQNDIKILNLEVCPDNLNDSDFRVLVDGKFIKYITIAPGIYETFDMCWTPALIKLLPPFPAGDWNQGHIAKDAQTGKPMFAEAKKADLPGVRKVWHPVKMEYAELEMVEDLRTSNIWVVKGREFQAKAKGSGDVQNVNGKKPGLNSMSVGDTSTSGINSQGMSAKTPGSVSRQNIIAPDLPLAMVAKYARLPWQTQWIENETIAYEWLDGHNGIGPKFLGHLTEHGRVFGFLMELIPNARHATPDDYTACRHALSELHKLKIKHGDINKHNFLIRDDGSATLIDFECAKRCGDEKALQEELDSLEDELRDTSGRGGRVTTISSE